LFNIWVPVYFHVQRFADEVLERRGVAGGRPQLELRVARGSKLEHAVFTPVVQLDGGDRL
jgi:hypothetical protein